MRELAREMAAALERADIDAVGESLNEHWEHQRTLHPSIPTPAIDLIITRARQSGALGAKAMGASGGGCVLIVARSDRIEGIRDTLTPLGDILDFDIDVDGLKIVRDSA
jgi:D-glycero-alpha-D-manno-heptose-7-phosphate kinase